FLRISNRADLCETTFGSMMTGSGGSFNFMIEQINPILRGWVNYFAMGHSSRCFAFIRDWVEKKIRSHLARACQRRGFGWKRWRRAWLYDTLGLFNQYRVSYRSTTASIP